MKKIFSLHTKLIILIILLALFMIGGGYFYLQKMTTTEAALNINKVKDVSKIYSYNVYSDFYFRITKYDEDGEIVAEYSELQPLKSSIGFDINEDKSKLELRTNESGKPYNLASRDDNQVKREIDILKHFKNVFGKIVATQDKDYVKHSIEQTKNTISNVFPENKIVMQDTSEELYHTINNLPISNMKVRHFQLDNIIKNLKGNVKVCPKDKWQPNILEWDFGEGNRIYLQYVSQLKNNDEGTLIKQFSKNKTIVRLVKINNNQLQKMYLMIENQKKKVKTIFMDSNGYMYTLIFQFSNPLALKKYMIDYLKIAFGIYFIDQNNFNNWFAKEQVVMEQKRDNISKMLIMNQNNDQEIGEDLLKHFGLTKCNYKILFPYGETIEIPTSETNDLQIKYTPYDKVFEGYKDLLTDNGYKKLLLETKEKLKVSLSIDKIDGWFTDGKKELFKQCPDGNIEACYQKIYCNDDKSMCEDIDLNIETLSKEMNCN